MNHMEFRRFVVTALYNAITHAPQDGEVKPAVEGLGHHFTPIALASLGAHTCAHVATGAALDSAGALEIVKETLRDIRSAWQRRRYYLDGHPVDVDAFIADNALGAILAQEIRTMHVGDRLRLPEHVAAGGFQLECRGSHAA